MIESLLDMILEHDRIVITTELNSKEQLDNLLRILMNYIGEDNYIEHNDDSDMFTDFLILHKHYNKRIISTTLNIWLSNTHITNYIFNDTKFILPYKNMSKAWGLPHFSGNQYSIPTKLLYSADLVMDVNENILSFDKIRNANYTTTKIDIQDLFTEERNLKIKKLKTLI